MLFKLDLILIISEIYFLFAIVSLLIFSVILNKILFNINIINLVVFSAIVISISILLLNFNTFHNNSYIFNYMLQTNLIVNIFVYILLSSLIFYLFIFWGYIKQTIFYLSFEYIIIILLVTFGLIFVIKSNNLLILYISLELSSLGLYILASYNKYSNLSVEAGIKYFILGAIASGILLLGIILIYGFTGFLNYMDIAQLSIYILKNLNNIYTNGLFLGLSLVFIALLFKLTIAPFHIWAPDIYKGSPLISVVFFAILPKIAILALFINLFLLNLDIIYLEINLINYYFVIISWLVGSTLAIYQTNLKRLLAYSSIVHMGFLLLSLTLFSINSVIFYQLIYIILLLNIFVVLLNLKNSNLKEISTIYELINLYKLNPYIAVNLSFIFFSFAGIPPLLGFFGKFFILKLVFFNEGLFFVLFLGLFFSIISSFYYLRIIKLIFIEFNVKLINFLPINKLSAWLISFTLFINIFAITNLSFLDTFKHIYI
jgi:NADH-quinone oxidoreductase subunit N